jgi:hypothetical protein
MLDFVISIEPNTELKLPPHENYSLFKAPIDLPTTLDIYFAIEQVMDHKISINSI